jgi:hypothetical protein
VIPVYSFTRVLFTNAKRTRGCGCSGHPASPTPSLGEGFMHNSGASRREREVVCGIDVVARSDLSAVAQRAKAEATQTPSFRDGPKDQTRNLEIPGSMLRIAPE